MSKALNVLDRAIKLALTISCLYPGENIRRWHRGNIAWKDLAERDKPGGFLKHYLSKDDREALDGLTSKETKSMRLDPEDLIYGY